MESAIDSKHWEEREGMGLHRKGNPRGKTITDRPILDALGHSLSGKSLALPHSSVFMFYKPYINH